ncbi:MAG: hypothetical protein JWQ69_3585 [Pseudomonas sp.]|nr:hypothetical protein [Pseudomonas sp.]
MKSRIWRMAGVSVLCLSISVQVLADQQSDQLERQKQQLQQQQEQMEKMEHERQKQEEQRKAEAREAQHQQALAEIARQRKVQFDKDMEKSRQQEEQRLADMAASQERQRQEGLAYQQKMAAQQLQRIADYNQHQFEKKLRKKEKEQDEQLEAQQRQLDYQQAQADQAQSAFLSRGEQREVVEDSPPAAAPEPVVALNTSFDLTAYPVKSQTLEQQQQVSHDCHMSAVEQSGFDPASVTYKPAPEVIKGYQQSMTKCFVGQGYKVATKKKLAATK